MYYKRAFCCTLLIPRGKFGPPYLGKTAAATKSSATQSYKCMLDLFVFL